jgi:predicted AAA+ superfamily ATPase
MTNFQLGVRLRSVDRARSLASPLAEFAREKFVLLSGPRQVGKTTLARAWAGEQAGI